MVAVVILVALVASHGTYFLSTGRVQLWAALASSVVQMLAWLVTGSWGSLIGFPAFGALFVMRFVELEKKRREDDEHG